MVETETDQREGLHGVVVGVHHEATEPLEAQAAVLAHVTAWLMSL